MKVDLRVLKQLLKNHPEPCYSPINVYNLKKWFEEFEKAFDEFEKQLQERLKRLKSRRAGSIYSEEHEQGMIIVLEEVLGE